MVRITGRDTGNVVKMHLGFRRKEPPHVTAQHLHLTGDHLHAQQRKPGEQQMSKTETGQSKNPDQ